MEEADGGTILLNEIGDLPFRLQAKLLDALEDKEVTRLGEVRPRAVDFRVIAATNRKLSEEVEKGNFRKDLYHRLNVVALRLPPLRERNGDLALLVKHFLAKSHFKVDPEELDLAPLHEYYWPGNVRELENEFRKYGTAAELIEGLNRWDKNGDKSVSGNSLLDRKTEAERIQITETVKRYNGNRIEAAKALGISKATLYRKIKQHDIELESHF